MQTLELSGNINIDVKNHKIPLNFYDNVIEIKINNFKVLLEFFNVFKALKNTQIDIFKFKKYIKIKVVSKNIVIKIMGNIARLFF